MTLHLGKTECEISYPLAAVMTAVLLVDRSMNVWCCFLAAVLHEGGHLWVLYRCHTPPRQIRLSLFDIAIVDRQQYRHSFSQALTIAAAGITVNFVSALLCWGFWRLTGWSWLMTLMTAHLTLGVFNALPVSALDGGQIVLLLLSRFWPPDTAERMLTVCSVLVLLPTACLGFLLLLNTRYNFTLLLAALYLIALLFLHRPTYHRQ